MIEIEDEHPQPRHGLTKDMAALVERCLGGVVPDRFVTWLGISKRNADRWVSGDSTLPPAIIQTMGVQSELVADMLGEFEETIEHYKAKGLHESLLKLRVREFSKTLPDTQPLKAPPRRPEPEAVEVEDDAPQGPRF